MGGDWCEDPKAGIGIDSHGDGEEMGYQGLDGSALYQHRSPPLNFYALLDDERKRKLTAVCSHQTRIGNLDAHLI
ncbi:hypothetical protein BHG04_11930 [Klebsiella pneumoniae]|nr:hypothetical protein BGP86_04615 [Klebsiella pneumoniae]OJJ92668.1 hypothetical protein BHG04_11930 [Klebsiella pneumoniae]